MRKLIALILIFIGCSVGLYYASEKGRKVTFMEAWSKDLRTLKSENQLHEGFDQIQSVELISKADDLKSLYKKNPLPIASNPQGKFKLEIFIDRAPHNNEALIQYDLVDTKTGNTVWELSRVIPL